MRAYGFVAAVNAAAMLVVGALMLAACEPSVPGQSPASPKGGTGTVVEHYRVSIKGQVKYRLKVKKPDGTVTKIRVWHSEWNRCPVGSAYPACLNGGRR